MHLKNIAAAVAVALWVLSASSQGLKSYSTAEDVLLPPDNQREVLGAWDRGDGCNRSFERVSKKIYEVTRCGSNGGSTGRLLNRVSAQKYLKTTSNNGDFYIVQPDGSLVLGDRDGTFATEPAVKRITRKK